MITLDQLITTRAVLEEVRQVLRALRGILLVNGGPGTGKTTTLVALAGEMRQTGVPCRVLLTDPRDKAAWIETSPDWEIQLVEGSEEDWRRAIHAARDRVAIVHELDYRNARPLVDAAKSGGNILTQMDSPFVGIDVAYPLQGNGITHAEMLQVFSCVLSQILAPRLCRECRAKVAVELEDTRLIHPEANAPMEVWKEIGCEKCERRGTRDRIAIQELLKIDERARPILQEYLERNVIRRPLPDGHVTMQESAREQVREGLLGLETYKREIFRNPVLRMHHQWESERNRAAVFQIASQHKTEFLAHMSHELRTPLNAIIGFSEALRDHMFGELNERQDDYLKDIHESGKHLLSLINDILDLSKIEAGHMELERAVFHLPTALANAMTLVRERALKHGIELTLNTADGLGDINADERKLKQILLNLLSNAVKFTPDGGRIELTAKRTDGYFEIAVKDSGVGIAPEEQPAVFQEFKQVGRDSARKAEGTGLGLALTKRLVELHGGEIHLESAPGEGSTFSFTLPVRQ